MKTIDLSQVKSYTEVTTNLVFAKTVYSYSICNGTNIYAPEGFRFTGEFRKPTENEYFLSIDLNARQESTQAIRLILKPVTKKKVYIFTETGEVRCPRNGETYKYNEDFINASGDFFFNTYPIYKVEIKEIEE